MDSFMLCAAMAHSTKWQDDSVTPLLINGKQYQLGSILYMSQVLRGRGTVCWLATTNGQQGVMKDTWADEARQWEETEFLEECQKNTICSHIPLLIDQEDVQVSGICNPTQSHCNPTIRLMWQMLKSNPLLSCDGSGVSTIGKVQLQKWAPPGIYWCFWKYIFSFLECVHLWSMNLF